MQPNCKFPSRDQASEKKGKKTKKKEKTVRRSVPDADYATPPERR
jgi:hypothetical protein